jgi:hypothetical protein
MTPPARVREWISLVDPYLEVTEIVDTSIIAPRCDESRTASVGTLAKPAVNARIPVPFRAHGKEEVTAPHNSVA